MLARLHVSRFQTVRVYHCRDAYALVLETRGFRAATDSLPLRSDIAGAMENSAATDSASPGFKLSFSGDCRPSDNFIEVCAFINLRHVVLLPELADLCLEFEWLFRLA